MRTLDRGDDGTVGARHRCRLAVKGNPHDGGPGGVLDIVAVIHRILIVLDDLRRFGQCAEVQVNILGDNLIFGRAVQDDLNHRIHVADVYLAVTVHIASGISATAQDDTDHVVHVADVHLTVGIHVTFHGMGTKGDSHDQQRQ